MISAAHKSSGKTTLSIGICAALHKKGLAVQPFKKGPDYIDPLWLGAAASGKCYNLDFYTMTKNEIREKFLRNLGNKDVALVEGNKGLYDGLDLDGSNSNAALAVELNLPVFLVLDTRGMTRGVAPLILGYQQFEPDINIAGIILNSVGGPRHESKLHQVIEHYTDAKVIGAVPRKTELAITERHLGLVPQNEQGAANSAIENISNIVSEYIDLDQLLSLSSQVDFPAGEFPLSDVIENNVADTNQLVIGYAGDEAFGFYYPDDLELFEQLGVKLIKIDLIREKSLPEIDALFIGGGFPETHLDQLQGNHQMRKAVRDFIEDGGVTYAECGGLMYLTRSVTWDTNTAEMVGVIDAEVRMHKKPQGRGYVQLAPTDNHLWPSTAKSEQTIRAHEFHYSGLENVQAEYQFAYKVKRGFGIDGQVDGLIYKNLLASYTHFRNTASNPWVEHFVEFIQLKKQELAA